MSKDIRFAILEAMGGDAFNESKLQNQSIEANAILIKNIFKILTKTQKDKVLKGFENDTGVSYYELMKDSIDLQKKIRKILKRNTDNINKFEEEVKKDLVIPKPVITEGEEQTVNPETPEDTES